MAAIVTGLIPILRTAVDSTATYKGRTMWFGLLCIRLVTVFLAQFPWKTVNDDFHCNTTSSYCIKACFNEYFDNSVVMAWHFLFILLVLSVLLMELFSSHLRSSFQKKKEREMESQSKQEAVSDPTMTVGGRMMIDFHKSKSSVMVYLFSIVLRIAVEVLFVYVLLSWVLPRLRDTFFVCNGQAFDCPAGLKCVVRGAAEKRMSVYALLFISALVILTSGLFCLYSIGHYLCNG
ncbi:gap junction beta-3 protein [Carassius auratus]|uniref:Gap junction beta-3 protein n=1 Tax=Carassius auratus TaxID=7957 RepID=A0A6P6QEY4_CARAU|nr:gap junction beta-3 protein-like [Carassius auratus]XP_052426785.1 gap junction beta-3 protein [Carassius gibelio]